MTEVTVEGGSPLVDIEGQLDQISGALQGMNPLLARGETAELLRGELPLDTPRTLRWSAFLVGVLRIRELGKPGVRAIQRASAGG